MAEGELTSVDPDDGLPAPDVGLWTKDKHDRLRTYTEITRAARRKYLGPRKAGASYIDLYCGAGRARVRGTDEFIDGSALVAWKASKLGGAEFTQVFVNDQANDLANACEQRLRALGAPVTCSHLSAQVFVRQLVPTLNEHGLHLAFVDPFGLALPFDVLRELAKLKRMDLLIQVSAMDLQRNWDSYSRQLSQSPLDMFNPGWQERVDREQGAESARLAFIHDWVAQLKLLGFSEDVRFDLVRGSKNQPLYWLVLIAKHEFAGKLWKKTVQLGKTQDLF